MMTAAANRFGIRLKSSKDRKEKEGIHELTHRPDSAWDQLKIKIQKTKIEPLPLDTPISDDKVRFVCISDTHSRLDKVIVPDGDVLLHGGDFTNRGIASEVYKFNEAMGKFPHRHKIVIAGNHELSFDELTCERVNVKDPGEVKKLLTNCTYLEESSATVYGIKIYGSPCQPEFMGWGFNIPRGEPIMSIWNKVPDDTDILLTHGPPVGFGDVTKGGYHVGCVELLHTVRHRVKPKYHVFGHIHEGYGIQTDGTTVYINASSCTASYRPTQAPIIFDMDLPPGVEKSTVSMEPGNGSHVADGFEKLTIGAEKDEKDGLDSPFDLGLNLSDPDSDLDLDDLDPELALNLDMANKNKFWNSDDPPSV